MIAFDESSRRRVNFSYWLGDGRDRLVHDDVGRCFEDFEFGDAPILFDSDFDHGRDLAAGRDAGRWLDPCTIKAIVQHIAIPAELRLAASAPRAATFPC